MKHRILVLLVAASLVLGGCGLFSAEVTRPTEPATEPVQQAPATEPTAEPTTEPSTEPSTEPPTEPDGITEDDLIGSWKIDSQYTVDQGGMSPRDLYGSAIGNGEGMTFYGDGEFEYFAGACYGEGHYSLNGNEIHLTLAKGDPQLKNNTLVIREGDVLRIGMDQYGDGNLVWWAKSE